MRARCNWRTIATIALIGALAATDLGGRATHAQTELDVIDFEQVDANRSGSPAAADLTDEFVASHGVRFVGAGVTPLVFDEQSFPPRPDLPRSGSTVITTCYSAEFCSNEVAMAFTRGHERISVWAGYAGPLSEPAALVIEAFDASRVLIDDAVVQLDATDAAVPVATPLAVADELGRIATVVVRWAEPDRFLSRLILDDLELAVFTPRPELTPEPESLSLDGTEGPTERAFALVNTGNVSIPIGSVSVASDGAADAFVLVATSCDGVLAVGEACDVVVGYDPSTAAPARGAVRVDERAGGTVAVVALVGGVDTTPPPPTTPPPTTAVPPPTSAPDDGGSGASSALVGIAVLTVLAIGGTLVRRRWRATRPTPAVVNVVPRPDPGAGGVEIAGVVSIGVRWAPGTERLWTDDPDWEVGR